VPLPQSHLRPSLRKGNRNCGTAADGGWDCCPRSRSASNGRKKSQANLNPALISPAWQTAAASEAPSVAATTPTHGRGSRRSRGRARRETGCRAAFVRDPARKAHPLSPSHFSPQPDRIWTRRRGSELCFGHKKGGLLTRLSSLGTHSWWNRKHLAVHSETRSWLRHGLPRVSAELLLLGQARLPCWLSEGWLTRTSQGIPPRRTPKRWLRARDANPPGSSVSLRRPGRPDLVTAARRDRTGRAGQAARGTAALLPRLPASAQQGLSAPHTCVYLSQATANEVWGPTAAHGQTATQFRPDKASSSRGACGAVKSKPCSAASGSAAARARPAAGAPPATSPCVSRSTRESQPATSPA